MTGLLIDPGFLGTGATFRSDVTLILILVTAVLFTIGWRLAVRKRYEPHRWMQTSAAILNSIVVLFTMISSFLIHILPGIPEKLNQGDYTITTIHAFVGMVGLMLGVFVVLRANKLVPKALRFRNYKLFMRISYCLYMLATLLGVVVYIVVYVYGV
jgi:uncharacterized membrane protein YozB (DUF420 family)